MNVLKIIEQEIRFALTGVILLFGYVLVFIGDEIIGFACWAAGVDRDAGPTDDEDPYA